ncbi:hypothetical protein AX15_003813 [Amanita polypyramis BW_CC]|nr:hypothetical protein AX15_003813 [Amanita polypyramis BW_CC]
MRESNFAFPAQNKACVCISAQLYDRRVLDTTAPLPLTNSLQHLQYLTNTSPKIREIMTMDGGLERLISMLWDFCLSPPLPENPILVYGLTPPGYRLPKSPPILNPTNFDKHAAFRFSLAFQCVVNIGVRGSEPIRCRVVQAGALDVVGCVLEAWLASKGFAIGPSSSATGIPRETREQRQARRAEQRQREEAAALARALQRQIQFEHHHQRLQNEQLRLHRPRNVQGINIEGPFVDENMELPPNRTRAQPAMLITDGRQANNNNNSDSEQANDGPTSAITPTTAGNPTRDRSGTIVARPVWDETNLPSPTRGTFQQHTHINPQLLLNHPQPQVPTPSTLFITEVTQYRRNTPSPSASTDTSRAETETEDEPEHDVDGDIDMDRVSRSRIANTSTGTVTSRRADREQRLHISASLHPGQRLGHGHGHTQLQNFTVYPHNALSPGSTGSTPASGSASPSPERASRPMGMGMRNPTRHQARFASPMGDRGAAMTMAMPSVGGDVDAHIIISDAVGGPSVVGDNINMAMGVGMGVTVGGVGVAGVEDGMESLQAANDDFAMGAPPGAPGAIVLDTTEVGVPMEDSTMGGTPRVLLGDDEGRRVGVSGVDSTPRAGMVDLPEESSASASGLQRDASVRARPASAGEGSAFDAEYLMLPGVNRMPNDMQAQVQAAIAAGRFDMGGTAATATNGNNANPNVRTIIPVGGNDGNTNASTSTASGSIGGASTAPTPTLGPYKDEDVLLGLQLLAYLSKYPHVRQAFYKPRSSFHPASLGLHQAGQAEVGAGLSTREKEKQREAGSMIPGGMGPSGSAGQGFFKSLAGRGRAALTSAGLGGVAAYGPCTLGVNPNGMSGSGSGAGSGGAAAGPFSATGAGVASAAQMRQTNVFSLVERFTFKPSSNEADLPNPPPRLPAEIQYWAGVIMRNACRKDESRGGIRQCANMLCGRWEQYPREFAKCRRCRKAKYCGKECQSTAWSEGHRFWCSARDADEDTGGGTGDRERDRDRGDRDGHHRTDAMGQPAQGQHHHHQHQRHGGHAAVDETGDMQMAVGTAERDAAHAPTTFIPIIAAGGTPGATQVSPRAERAARRERERERRMRDLRELTADVTVIQRPPGFGIDLTIIPPGFPARTVPPAPLQQVQQQMQNVNGNGNTQAGATEVHQGTGPIAGPSHGHGHDRGHGRGHGQLNIMMTEAAVQHQQRMMHEQQRIVETDWLLVHAPQAQVVGPAQGVWNAMTDMPGEGIPGEETDMVLG